jgi:hypothetical protein
MVVVNLTHEYLKTNIPTIAERFKGLMSLDHYYANSLGDMQHYFLSNPPRKFDLRSARHAAYVSLEGMHIRRCEVDDMDEKQLECAFNGMPLFEIKDITSSMAASWDPRTQSYIDDVYRFGINTETYAFIPLMVVKYVHDGDNGRLFVERMEKNTETVFNGLESKVKAALRTANVA